MSALLIAFGYLAGSVPFGVLVTRAFTSRDVRSHGSGNIGASNVTRVAGKKLGALVLLLDAAKGAGPTWLASALSGDPPVVVATAAAAFLGHVFPVWLRFKGGKGVATALGIMAVVAPWAALSGALVFAALVALWRVASVGSLAGGLVAVVVSGLTATRANALLTAGLFVSMLWTHRANIARLVARRENRL